MVVTKPSYKLIIVAPTCFYYQVALFRHLSTHPRIELTVCFCSKEALYARDVVRMYKTAAPWGDEQELLEGFKYKFVRNYSPWPSYLMWPFGLMNFGIWNEIRRKRPDGVILMSWANITWWVAILACVYYRIPFFYMTDANGQIEPLRSRWKIWLKKILLGRIIFRSCAGFLCAGAANKSLFSFYSVPERKLFAFAYSWGYESLVQDSLGLKSRRKQIRAELGITGNSFVILFCGRLSKEKDPRTLLEVYRRVNLPHTALIFVGDGELRESLQECAANAGLTSVYFLGFQNRKEIPKFYAIADALVLPSYSETWGIVVNEAMCFGLPVIVSDRVGAGPDLVQHGNNGFIFPAGDAEALAGCIRQLMDRSEEERLVMGMRSLDIIKKWSQKDLRGLLVQYLDSVCSNKRVTSG